MLAFGEQRKGIKGLRPLDPARRLDSYEISKNKDDYSCVNPIVNAAKSVLDLYKCSKWPEAKILGQTVKIAQADIAKFWNEYVENENLGLSFRMSPRGVMSFPETRDDY